MIDQVVAKTGGNIPKMIRQLGFVMPELMKENTILQNVNAGLDKNGRALKFQTRTAEILNYSFQLMARSIGQMYKNWLVQLNPLTQIKRAFSDFASYDVKWKRTLNVIKYNIRAILRPFMEWIAQKIINIIGFLDVISMKMQEIFGKTPVSLFDQSAADAEKMREALEAAANVSAGFDELHDIGSDNSAENDLFGEIYKPEPLSDAWKTFGEILGSIFAGIAKVIGWCIENWKIFAGLLAGFFVAKGLINLFNFFTNLSKLISGLPKLFGAVGKALGIVAGVAAVAYAGFKAYDLGKNWDQKTEQERNSDNIQSVGFGALGGAILGGIAGGPIGAVIGASIGTALMGGINAAIASYNGDEIRNEINSTIGGAGAGLAIGAKIGSIISPGIGTAVGAALGAVVGAIGGNTIAKMENFFTAAGGSFSNLKISADDLKWATEQLTIAQDNELKALSNLKTLEEQTGYSGKELYEAVQNGSLSYDKLNSSQLQVIEAYKSYIKTCEDTKIAIQRVTDFKLAQEFENAKLSGSYDELVQHMIKAKDDGIYTEEELTDRLSQLYAELNAENREVFMNNIPEEMRQGIEEGAYQYFTGWEKFKIESSKNWEKFKTNWGKLWGDVGKVLSNKWEDIKNAASEGWRKIVEAITGWVNSLWNSITETFNNIKTSAEETWQRVCNFFKGKGFKTDSQVDNNGNTNTSIVPKYAKGTNYVPSDGLAYLHQGEAVIPKKYNQSYNQGMSNEERAYMQQIMSTMRSLNDTMQQGINVKGEFRQRGSDLVAVVNKTKSQTGADLLSNVSYAR